MEILWLAHKVVEQMILEAEQKAPLETGGLLAGYFSKNDKETVVTDIIGPGPMSVHKMTTYKPDYSFHRDEIGQIYDNSNGEISYLGDWHTHPTQSAYLSWTDREALRNIVRYQNNFLDAPVMLIWGGVNSKGDPEWIPRAWRTRSLKGKMFWRRWDYAPMEVRLFK